jgi:hypothetical protein
MPYNAPYNESGANFGECLEIRAMPLETLAQPLNPLISVVYAVFRGQIGNLAEVR